MTAEDLLIDYARGLAFRQPEPTVREKVVHCLLDALSLARAAGRHPVVVAVSDAVAGSSGPVTAWTDGRRLAPSDAALLNGAAVHAFFQDDTDMSAWAHPASLVPPAVLAAAQLAGEGFPAVIRGMVAGYAALSWLAAEEEVARALVERGFRASPTLGAMAAAIGAGVALGLEAEDLRNALAIAADSTGGVLEPVRVGAQDWRLQNGFAAQRGFLAASLARAGVRGPEAPLTGSRGFASTFADGISPVSWDRPPRDEAILDVWFKPYPTLGDNMAPVVAASMLTARLAEVGEPREVRVRMNSHFASYPGTQYTGPFVRTEQMIGSTAFGVATLLVHGAYDYADYTSLISDARVLDLVARTSIEPRDDYGYLDGEVDVIGSSGTISARAQDAPASVFFRDRDATTAVLRHRGDGGLLEVQDALFAAAASDEGWPDLGEALAAGVAR
jgi:2-methylcitrate dehydratase PrpD